MAECESPKPVESSKSDDIDDIKSQNKVQAQDVHTGTKRAPSRTPSPGPPQKSPWGPPAEAPSLTCGTEAVLGESQAGGEEGVRRDGAALSPRSRRRSWRRSARTRRSFPALCSSSQALCRSISLSLQEEERLEKLIDASKELAVQKLQDCVAAAPGGCRESLHSQVELLQREWCCLAQDIRQEVQGQLPQTSTDSDPAMQKTMDQIRKSVLMLQAERDLWDSVLLRHRSKAEELARRVEQGRAEGVAMDPACLMQSSQSQLILSKPDYHSALLRQHGVLHTMEMLMDSRCKIVRELLSFQEQSHMLVKEISGTLASSAGFQTLPSSPVRKLLTGV
ncbi:kinetochore-associated protein DSN1 homolog [Megalops cyprinoides]|uniref:kinetochore-associated protein DSN1 homolog n=1 Tax=Megalops cyprinoides TaxID=118141 RepID=UPI001864BC97|nr:kinetochore-associated protein DSN1 homolog [Megalops cyprinoides]